MIELKKVKVLSPEGGNVILDNINVVFKKGDRVAVEGFPLDVRETFFKLLAGYIEPFEGEYRFFGNSVVYRLSPKFIRQRRLISFMSLSLSPISNMSILDNVRLYYKWNFGDVKKKHLEAIVEEKLKLAGLWDKRHYRPSVLSFEERKLLVSVMQLKEDARLIISDGILSQYHGKEGDIYKFLEYIRNKIILDTKIVVMTVVDYRVLGIKFNRYIFLTDKGIAGDIDRREIFSDGS